METKQGNVYVINKRSIRNANRSGSSSLFGSKIIGIILAFFIIGVLLFSLPAAAFVLDLSSDKTSAVVGENIVFTASINVNSNENLPIDKLELELNNKGGENISCEFYSNGTLISACDGITIKQMSDIGYGYGYSYGNYNGYGYNFDNNYGYGYSYGVLNYEITLDTTNHSAGTYDSVLKLFVHEEIFSKDGGSITINEKSNDNNDDNIISGSGSGLVSCNNAWDCSNWSICLNGKSVRSCELKSNCYGDFFPEEERTCDSSSHFVNNFSNLTNNNLSGGIYNYNTTNSSGINNQSISTTTFSDRISGITGAVIGIGSGNKGIILIIILLLLVLFAIVFIAIRVILGRKGHKGIKFKETEKFY